MADGLRMRIKNARQFHDAVAKKRASLRGMRKTMNNILSYQEESIVRGTIQKQRTIKKRGGRLFRPLTPKYERRKAKKFPDAPILVMTGKMTGHRSFGRSIIAMAGKITGFLFYRGPKYGIYHQDEAKEAKIQTPRPWFGFRAGDLRRILAIARNGVRKALRS